MPDQAILPLGIEGLRPKERQKFFSVQELPQEMSVDELGEHVKNGLKFRSCRIFGDDKTRIRSFAFLIGGFGENQLHMPQAARDMGAEAIIIGEMSEFIVIACLEMGMPVIDGVTAGVKFIEAMIGAGFKTSKSGAYAPPRDK